mmetsp:Transcript_6176/g.12558  ORF Transcript_6176/g.12558 Transcript_6176/m.12558 type:complete len:344 (+) Transcript_6176:68-1099(+)
MMRLRAVFLTGAALALYDSAALDLDDSTAPVVLLQTGRRFITAPLAPKLHFLSMGRSGSCFWGQLFGKDAGRPYIFEPFNVGQVMWSSPAMQFSVRDGWNFETSAVEQAELERRLRCIYTCQGCESLLSAEGIKTMDHVCDRPATTDMTIVKTVAMNNATSLTTMLPHGSLRGSKFVLLLRDPRSTGRDNACQRMLSLSLSIKQLATVVGKDNVRTIFMEEWTSNVSESVSDVATWAGIPASEVMLQNARATQKANNSAEVASWISEGVSAISLGEEAWCKEFFELVGYPAYSPSAMSSDPFSVDYSHLTDPSQTPMTPTQELLLERLWRDGSAFSFAQGGKR